MGWASGSQLAIDMANSLKEHVTDENARRAVYEAMVESLCQQDWDTLDEAMGIDPILDEVLDEQLSEDEDEDDDHNEDDDGDHEDELD